MAVAYRSSAAFTTTIFGAGVGGTFSVPQPAGFISTDAILAFISFSDSTRTITPPAGWTLVKSWSFVTKGRLYRAVNPTDFLFSISAGSGTSPSRVLASGAAYSGARLSNPVHVVGASFQGVSSTPAAPSVVLSAEGCFLIGIYTSNAAGQTYSDHWGKQRQKLEDGITAQAIMYEDGINPQEKGGDSGVRQITQSGANSDVFLIALQPEVAAQDWGTTTDIVPTSVAPQFATAVTESAWTNVPDVLPLPLTDFNSTAQPWSAHDWLVGLGYLSLQDRKVDGSTSLTMDTDGVASVEVTVGGSPALTLDTDGTATLQVTVDGTPSITLDTDGSASVQVTVDGSTPASIDTDSTVGIEVAASEPDSPITIGTTGDASVQVTVDAAVGVPLDTDGAASVQVTVEGSPALTLDTDGAVTLQVTADAAAGVTLDTDGAASVQVTAGAQAAIALDTDGDATVSQSSGVPAAPGSGGGSRSTSGRRLLELIPSLKRPLKEITARGSTAITIGTFGEVTLGTAPELRADSVTKVKAIGTRGTLYKKPADPEWRSRAAAAMPLAPIKRAPAELIARSVVKAAVALAEVVRGRWRAVLAPAAAAEVLPSSVVHDSQPVEILPVTWKVLDAEDQPIAWAPAFIPSTVEQIVEEVIQSAQQETAIHASVPVRPRRRRRVKKVRMIRFDKLIRAVSARFGAQAAAAWTQAVTKFQREINMQALEAAIASGNSKAIEVIVSPAKLQKQLEAAMIGSTYGIVAGVGAASAQLLTSRNLNASFNATHPTVVRYARERAAEMVVGIATQTRLVIAEVVARGASGLLTVQDQARAVREVVGLPPNWSSAPRNLAAEIRAGNVAAATSRRLSAVAKQQIRSRITNGTVTPTFISGITEQYAASLINLRATMISRTETLRAAHFGLNESWKQAQQQGILPRNVKRFWIVTPDDRLSEAHAEIPGMNPDGRGLDEEFDTPDGPCLFPPSRPNCRCSIALGFGAAEEMAENKLSPPRYERKALV